MTWGTFFSSPPIKFGAVAGGFGLAIGLVGSAALALNLSSQCSAVVATFFSTLDQNVTISELTALITIKGHSTPVTLTQINVVIPDSVTRRFNSEVQQSC